jgi:UDP-glucose 4-epimerase
MRILVTGGAGYIGSHACWMLLEKGYQVSVIDSLVNGHRQALERVEHATQKSIRFIQGSINHRTDVDQALEGVEAVLHFAGLKAVGESNQHPLDYYHNNISGTLTLLQAMKEKQIKNLIFSSSATVYGLPQVLPINESHPLDATNPYGRTKLMIEQILRDLGHSDPEWAITLLRYFNPIGAHPSGLIGESPHGAPNNLAPYIAQVALGLRSVLSIFGDDYPTPDGTGVRDYIHVMDLIDGHICALTSLKQGVHSYNLGTGQGYSVLDLVSVFKEVSQRPIPYQVLSRRKGDVAICYADPSKAQKDLGWTAHSSLKNMIDDAWRWQTRFPNGYV